MGDQNVHDGLNLATIRSSTKCTMPGFNQKFKFIEFQHPSTPSTCFQIPNIVIVRSFLGGIQSLDMKDTELAKGNRTDSEVDRS